MMLVTSTGMIYILNHDDDSAHNLHGDDTCGDNEFVDADNAWESEDVDDHVHDGRDVVIVMLMLRLDDTQRMPIMLVMLRMMAVAMMMLLMITTSMVTSLSSSISPSSSS